MSDPKNNSFFSASSTSVNQNTDMLKNLLFLVANLNGTQYENNAMFDLWKNVGRPSMSNVGDGDIVQRGNYDFVNNSIKIKSSKDVIPEFSHAFQRTGEGGVNKTAELLLFLKALASNNFNFEKSYDTLYDNPSSLEYQAHTVIDPELRNDYSNSKIQRYYNPMGINSYAERLGILK